MKKKKIIDYFKTSQVFSCHTVLLEISRWPTLYTHIVQEKGNVFAFVHSVISSHNHANHEFSHFRNSCLGHVPFPAPEGPRELISCQGHPKTPHARSKAWEEWLPHDLLLFDFLLSWGKQINHSLSVPGLLVLDMAWHEQHDPSPPSCHPLLRGKQAFNLFPSKPTNFGMGSTQHRSFAKMWGKSVRVRLSPF